MQEVKGTLRIIGCLALSVFAVFLLLSLPRGTDTQAADFNRVTTLGRSITATGVVRSYHVDDLEFRAPREGRFFLSDSSEAYDLVGSKANIPVGTRVKITGYALGSTLAVSEKETIESATSESQTSQTQAAAPATMKIAVIMLDFPDAPVADSSRPPLALTNALSRANTFYEANSQGKTHLETRIFGWYRSSVPLSTLGCSDSNRFDFIRNAITTADPSIDYRQFQYVLVYAPSAKTCFTDVSGFAFYERSLFQTGEGSIPLYISAVFVDRFKTFVHELGHNLGLYHSRSVDCPRVFIPRDGQGCFYGEYGDSLDVMGSGTGHFNAIQKNLVGYLNSSQIKEITRSGLYSLDRFEADTSGLKALKIQRWTAPIEAFSSEMWIEYRRHESVDGALIRIPSLAPSGGVSRQPNLLRLSFSDGFFLKVGKSVYDYDSRTKIDILSTTVGDIRKLLVRVTLNAREPIPPPPPPACTLNGQQSSLLVKPVNEEFGIQWGSQNADYLSSLGWQGSVDCGKGNPNYDPYPYKCRNEYLAGGRLATGGGWGPLYMREPGSANIILIPTKNDGTIGQVCSIIIVNTSFNSSENKTMNLAEALGAFTKYLRNFYLLFSFRD